MIHYNIYCGDSEQECIDKINQDIPDSSKIISIVPAGKKWIQYDDFECDIKVYLKVYYRD